MKRDAKKDLEMCEKATSGKWEAGDCQPHKPFSNSEWHSGVYAHSVDKCVALTGEKDDEQSLVDAFFIAESRETLPYWINRAVESERKLKLITDYLTVILPGVKLLKLPTESLEKWIESTKEFLG